MLFFNLFSKVYHLVLWVFSLQSKVLRFLPHSPAPAPPVSLQGVQKIQNEVGVLSARKLLRFSFWNAVGKKKKLKLFSQEGVN